MNLSQYFEQNRPQPVYEFGARVFGHYNKIPFVGTVYTDNMRNEHEGPMCSVHLDLPLKDGKTIHNFIRVKHKQIKRYK